MWPRFPFDNGRKFTIRIMTTPDCYRILVNNWDFVCFNHRIPPSEVRYLQLTDGAEYYETLVQNNCVSPCLLYTSPSPRDISGSRMPSSA